MASAWELSGPIAPTFPVGAAFDKFSLFSGTHVFDTLAPPSQNAGGLLICSWPWYTRFSHLVRLDSPFSLDSATYSPVSLDSPFSLDATQKSLRTLRVQGR